jgi:hypothetical protein
MKRIHILMCSLLFFILQTEKVHAEGKSVDSTTVEFYDKQFEKKVKIQLTIDVPNLPTNLTTLNLIRELGANEIQIDSIQTFMKNGQASKKYSICINDVNCLTIKIVSLDEKVKDEKNQNENPVRLSSFFPKRDVGFYLGFNQWNPVNTIKLDNKLNDWKSRYFAISFKKYTYIGKIHNLEFAVGTAPEIAWYNFHLKNDRLIEEQADMTRFVVSNVPLKKSKIVVPMVNVPLTINIGLKDSGWMLSTGPSVGFRYGGFSKVKSREEGRQKVKSDFNMSKLFVGWGIEIGKVSGMKFFFKNDFTPLFQVEQRGERVWSFGIRI